MIKVLLPVLLIAAFAIGRTWLALRQSRKMLAENARPLEDLVLERQLAKVSEAAEIPKIQVKLWDVPMINGLATADGEIFITAGLYRKYLQRRVSAEELVSVVAHELGHVALGHTEQRVQDVTGTQIAQILLGSVIARFIPIIGWYIAAWLASLFMSGLSRKAEYEADRFGAALMMKAGFGTEPQARMLEKLLELTPEMAHRQPPAWLASHPPVEERARRIRALGTGWLEAPN